jgi:alcohol dehydrogenase class IV
LLRESSKAKAERYDLKVLTGAAGDGQIPHGALLVAFAEAVLGTDEARLVATRADIRQSMGDAALVDAAAVAATFNAIDRVADATGIPIEHGKAEATADLRASLGIDAFAENRGERADPR